MTPVTRVVWRLVEGTGDEVSVFSDFVPVLVRCGAASGQHNRARIESVAVTRDTAGLVGQA